MTVDTESFLSQSSPEYLSDILKSGCETPCDQFEDCGSGDCSDKPEKKPAKAGFWQSMFVKGLHNTLNLAFDEVYQEPKKILMIGGCRQTDFARHVALLLPAADITLVDPDANVTERAKAEICCRFKFETSEIESMPFDNGQFDLIIAHNLPEYVQNQAGADAEIARITSKRQGNVMLSTLNPLSMNLFSWLPGFKSGLMATGVDLKASSVDLDAVKRVFTSSQGSLALEVNPLPWQWLVFRFESR
jgi:hypothetical protein